MPDVGTRLAGCFMTVFPGLSMPDVWNASRERMERCDSEAAITLVSVVQEEFSTQIDYCHLQNLHPFAKVLEYFTVDRGFVLSVVNRFIEIEVT